jgi:hypothetical protein
MQQPLPSAPPKTRKKKGKRHEEGDAQAFMAGDALHPKGRDVFILDTGCIGSHVFMESQHVSDMSNNTSRSVKDFSGTSHNSSGRGTLLSTSQKVLVMPNSKVNLLSTEQIFQSKMASFAVLTKSNFILFDEKSRPVLNAYNPGDGSYICTSKDLTKAFGRVNASTIAGFTLSVDDPPTMVKAYSAQIPVRQTPTTTTENTLPKE